MRVHNTPLEGLKLIELKVHGDQRGFFVERFNYQAFKENNLPTTFMQDNHSRSSANVLRGLHYQYDEPQGKLVGVVRGAIFDVAVDIRAGSPTYGQWYGVELNEHNGKLLWIPPGFAHGFCTLKEEINDVIYKVTTMYHAKGEAGIAWDDPDIGIDWPISNPTLSDRDQSNITLADYGSDPKFNY